MPTWVTPTILKYFGIGVTALVVVLSAYMKGRHDVKVKFDAYKVEVAAAAKAQELKTKEIETRQQKINEDTKNAYNNQLASLRAYYSMRNGKGGGSLPQVPAATGGVNGEAFNNLSSLPPVATLAAQCSETTLTLVTLQEWVKSMANSAE